HLIMHQYYPELVNRFPIVDAKQRGAKAIQIAHDYELVLFEYFISDKAGHSQDFDTAKYVIETLEQFIAGMYEALSENDSLIISSDHGNLEDLSVKTHTLNPVPLLVAGHLQKEFKHKMNYLYDIPRRIYDIYGFEPLTEPQKTT
ncbi:MAG: metalloenzyme, partial [Leptonema sp. (in: Bacteria)]|nr:metalloenzyme [Leptonema sp. (in: bacteria)]